jgi:membrane protein YqaA with SNARE-associated domain
MTGLAGLFLAAFLAATPAPLPSEPVFLALQAAGWPLLWLIIVASVGNTLGSCVTYALGRGAERLKHHRWFPLTPATLSRAQGWWSRWGLWSLLLSWAPGGDALVALAGLMRVPFWRFVGLVALAKTARYAVLAGAMSALV